MIRLTCTLSDDQVERLKEKKERHGASLSFMIREALEEYLNKGPEPRTPDSPFPRGNKRDEVLSLGEG